MSQRAGLTLEQWQTAISVKGINMQSAQMIAPSFSFQSPVRLSNTLDDFRIVHDNYDSSGSFSARAMRPVWIAALLIAVGAGIAAYLGMFPEHDGVEISKPKIAPVLAVPTAATTNRIAPSAAPVAAARDGTAATGSNASAGTEAANAMPPAPATIRSETIAPIKAKGNVAKPVSAPAQKVAPPPTTAENALTLPPQEAAPASPPAPIVEEKPVVPTPSPASTPEIPQVDPPKL